MNEIRKRAGTIIFLCLVIIFTGSGISNMGKTVDAAETWTDYLDNRWIECEEIFQSWQPEREAAVNKLTPWKGGETAPSKKDEDEYYLIETPEEFCYALKNPGTYKKIRLQKDLDLGGLQAQEWVPVSMTSDMTIDGNEKIIYNLFIASSSSEIGLFSIINNINFELYDLHFMYADITGITNVGPIAARLENGKIKNCSVEKSIVQCTNQAGGILGMSSNATNGVLVENCHTKNVYVKGTGDSRGYSCVGNFCCAIGGIIRNCYAIDGVTISYKTHSGGFISCTRATTIVNCFTNSDIYASSLTGGFSGYPQGSGNRFINCFSSGVVEGSDQMGGFIGSGYGNSGTTYTNCYSTSMVGMQSTATNLGGFSGHGGGSSYNMESCYAVGEVGNVNSDPNKIDSLGGFEGITSSSNRTSCFYDKQTTAMGEYGVGSRSGNSNAGVTGKLTKNMTGDGLKGSLDIDKGTDAWTFNEGMYPQLSVFANADSSFGDAEDIAVAKAYSAASVCTAYLSPSNLAKDPADPSKYDTVRDIHYLFPLTNNKKAGTGPDSQTGEGKSFDISWIADPGYYSTVIDSAEDIPIVSLSPKTFAVSSLAPGIGWVTSQVRHTYTDEAGEQKQVTGSRRMRIIPTTSISLSDSAGVDKTIYAVPDNINDDEADNYMENTEDVRYDHRSSVMFVMGDVEKLQTNDMEKATFPEKLPENAGDFEKTIFTKENLGSVKVSIGKVIEITPPTNKAKAQAEADTEDEEDKIKTTPVTINDDIIKLFTAQRPARSRDKGTYVITYQWYPQDSAGEFDGDCIESSKNLTVIDPLSVTYHYNRGEEGTDDIYYRKELLKVGETVKKLPARPKAPGYTFEGWATVAGLEQGDADFTAETKLEKNMDVYALWKPAPYVVNGTKSGPGTVRVENAEGNEQPDGLFNKNEKAKVTWQADAGSYVSRVIIDGSVRDDLIGKNSITYEKVQDDHTVYVEFKEGHRAADSSYYTISTKKINGGEGCLLTDTATIAPGKDHIVTWKTASGYEVRQVLLNGRLYSTKESGSISFKGVRSDHTVEVLFAAKPDPAKSTDAPADPSYYTVTTRSSGPGTISPCVSSAENSTVKISWQPDAGSRVSSVLVDGKIRNDLLKAGCTEFTWLDSNHSVEVEFIKDDAPGVPDEKNRIETSIAGGPGTISPSASVTETDGQKTVEWKIADGLEGHFKVSAVYVDGQKAAGINPETDKRYTFSNLNENHSIAVILEPVLHNITTTVTYGGKIDNSVCLPHKSGKNIKFSRDLANYDLESIEITKIINGTVMPTATYKVGDDISAVPVIKSLNKDRGKIELKDIDCDYKLNAKFTMKTGTAPDQKHMISTKIIGGPGSISPGGEVAGGADSKASVTWKPGDGYKVADNGIKLEAPDGTQKTSSRTKAAFSNITGPCSVTVTLVPDGRAEIDTPAKIEEGFHIDTAILGASGGTITPSINNIPGGGSESRDILWSTEEESGNRITGVIVDGVLRDDLLNAGKTTFSSIAENHSVYALQNGKTGNSLRPEYTIEVRKNPGGTASDTALVPPKTDHEVFFKANPGYKTAAVLLDGVEIPGLNDKDSLKISKVQGNHIIEIRFERTDGVQNKAPCFIQTGIGSGQGVITPSVYTAAGDREKVSFSPAGGFYLTGVIIDGKVKDELVFKGIKDYTFENIRENHSLEVQYGSERAKKAQGDLVFIRTEIKGKGTISHSRSISRGDDCKVSWKPAAGYKAAAVYVDGSYSESLSGKTEMVFDKAERDHEIEVIFESAGGTTPPAEPVYPVTIKLLGGRGSITASGWQEKGAKYSVVCTPEKGYRVARTTINGKPVKGFLETGSDSLTVTEAAEILVYLEKEPENSGGTQPGKDENKGVDGADDGKDSKPHKGDQSFKKPGQTGNPAEEAFLQKSKKADRNAISAGTMDNSGMFWPAAILFILSGAILLIFRRKVNHQ